MSHSKSLLDSLEGNEVIHVWLPSRHFHHFRKGHLATTIWRGSGGALLPIDSGLKSLDWSINPSPERGTRPMKNLLPWPQSLFVIIPSFELGNFFEVSFRLSLQTLSSAKD